MAEPSYVRARVIGRMPIRDVVTRESVGEGGIVRLLVREANGERPAPCTRHPKKGVRYADQACTCGGTLLDALVEGGSIELLDDEPTDTPAETTKVPPAKAAATKAAKA